MKNRSPKTLILLLTVCIIASLCLTSCGMLRIMLDFGDMQSIPTDTDGIVTEAPADTNGMMDSTEQIDEIQTEASGNDEENNEDNSEENIDNNIGDVGNDSGDDDISIEEENPGSNVTIQGAESNVAYAAAQGLRSSVSIIANFSSGNSSGSGIIYKLDAENGSAFIITNYHVVYYSGSYYQGGVSKDIDVYLYGMEMEKYALSALFVGGSANYDIAVLYVENSEVLKNAAKNGSIVAVKAADSDKILPGQTAIAIGNAESLGIAVTSGVISVPSEYIEMTSIDGKNKEVEQRVMRIDTAVNSGNSGGGLFNDKGEFVGIVNAKITQSDVENIAYAIPSNVAKAVAENIINYCYGTEATNVMRPILGLQIEVADRTSVYDPDSATISISETIRVNSITEGSISVDKFAVGDVLKSITVGGETTEITRMHHVIDRMLYARENDTVSFKVVGEDGTEKTVNITITKDCLTAY